MKNKEDYNADADAKLVLNKMKNKGQFDIVKVNTAEISFVGNPVDGPNGGTFPKQFIKDENKGTYLLTNGGYFKHVGDERKYAPAGLDTKILGPKANTATAFPNPFDEPEDYKTWYTTVEGSKGTKIHSGPDLKKEIKDLGLKQGIWKHKASGNPVGSLNHAAENNERIALLQFGSTSYSISYTCEHAANSARECGLPTDKFGELIDFFFSKMGETGKSISLSQKAVCLDGGPSVALFWVDSTKPDGLLLSQGGIGDNVPSGNDDMRKLGNLVKIVPK